MLRCPSCDYVRQGSDQAPEWQCPACEKAYSKLEEGEKHYSRDERAAMNEAYLGKKAGLEKENNRDLHRQTLFYAALLGSSVLALILSRYSSVIASVLLILSVSLLVLSKVVKWYFILRSHNRAVYQDETDSKLPKWFYVFAILYPIIAILVLLEIGSQ